MFFLCWRNYVTNNTAQRSVASSFILIYIFEVSSVRWMLGTNSVADRTACVRPHSFRYSINFRMIVIISCTPLRCDMTHIFSFSFLCWTRIEKRSVEPTMYAGKDAQRGVFFAMGDLFVKLWPMSRWFDDVWKHRRYWDIGDLHHRIIVSGTRYGLNSRRRNRWGMWNVAKNVRFKLGERARKRDGKKYETSELWDKDRRW